MSPTQATGRLADLAVDPYNSLAVHFGMLLGVSDIELLAANPRGKLRLHNRWLHGAGVVWGFREAFEAGSRELSVGPGLALDGRGRELHLATAVCLDLDQWYEANRDRYGEPPLALDVVARHRACLDRPVPALAGECGDSPGSAYSRVRETAQIDLVPVVDRTPTTFPRLREALAPGAIPPDAAEIARLAAADSLDLAPANLDDAAPTGAELADADVVDDVVVARVVVTVDQRPDIAADAIDHSVRRVHLPTTLVMELLMARLPQGPSLDAHDVAWTDDRHLTIGSNAPLHPATLVGAVTAHRWDPAAGNWLPLGVTPAFAGGRLVLELGEAIAPGTTAHVVVTGRGKAPVTADVGGRPVPLTADTVLTIERS